jgi:hypothetical protein
MSFIRKYLPFILLAMGAGALAAIVTFLWGG